MSLRNVFGFLKPKLLYSQVELPTEEFPLQKIITLLISNEQGHNLRIGDSLKSGQQIFSAEKELIAYSPATGIVKEITNLNWIDETFTAIKIETKKDVWSEQIEEDSEYLNKSRDDLLTKLKNAGCIFSLDEKTNVNTVIVNCLERDLIISNKMMILRKDSANIKDGITLLKKITGAKKVIFAVTDNQLAILDAIPGNIETMLIEPVYPSGMPQVILDKVYEQNAGENAVIDLEEFNAMVLAAKSGKPFLDKIVTLIRKDGVPIKNIKLRIGTSISDVLEANRIFIDGNDRLILGGPMQGKAVSNTDFPIVASADAIYLQGKDEVIEMTNTSCLNCGKCIKVCPYNLQVNLLSRFSEFSIYDKCEELDIDACIECGLCSYVCTSRRPLVQYIQFAKRQLKKMKEEESQ